MIALITKYAGGFLATIVGKIILALVVSGALFVAKLSYDHSIASAARAELIQEHKKALADKDAEFLKVSESIHAWYEDRRVKDAADLQTSQAESASLAATLASMKDAKAVFLPRDIVRQIYK